MRDDIRPRRWRLKEAFVPLAHPAGQAQANFGEATVELGGVAQKIRFFVVSLPQSDAMFVKAYHAETTEAFYDGHVEAFAFPGGVPLSILYDNTRLAVAQILGDGTRKRSRMFSARQSHYLFDDRFGRPARGTDKVKVEGMAGFARRSFMVPGFDFDAAPVLNKRLVPDLARGEFVGRRENVVALGRSGVGKTRPAPGYRPRRLSARDQDPLRHRRRHRARVDRGP